MSNGSSSHLQLLLAMRNEARTLEALLDRELSQWHGLSADDFLLILAAYEAPEHQIERVALAEMLGERMIDVVKRIRPLQRIGLVAETPEEVKDIKRIPVQLTDQGVQLLENALTTANDVAGGALVARWDRSRIDMLFETFGVSSEIPGKTEP